MRRIWTWVGVTVQSVDFVSSVEARQRMTQVDLSSFIGDLVYEV